MPIKANSYELSDLTIVKFDGKDSQDFLHSQLTNAVLNMPINAVKPVAYCTAQGRIVANGLLFAKADNLFYFIIAKDLAATFVKRISMFRLRLSVTIEILENINIYGLTDQSIIPLNLQQQQGWSGTCVDDEIWLKYPEQTNQACLSILISAKKFDNNNDKNIWHALRLAQAWPIIRSDVQETFLPASLNMDLNGTIDFAKGCYPGQEIIARSHYRGTVKRRLAYGETQSNKAAIQFNDLYEYESDYSRPIARVIEAAMHSGKIYLNAEVNTADIAERSFSLGSDEPKLKLELIQ